MRTMLLVMAVLLGCGSASPANETDAPLNGNDGGGSDDGGGGDGGGSGGDPTWYRSGSRIKMIVLNTPDGAKQFSGWHDVSRNEDCSFAPTSDGTTRCLPLPIPLSATIYEAPSWFWFADAACTMPVARLPSSCSQPPTYVLTATPSPCQTSIAYTAVYQRGPMYTSAYQKNGAACTTLAPDPAYVFYGLGAAVPLTAFQTATRAVE